MLQKIKAVSFDEKQHRYFYAGKELYGITRVIGDMMGKKYPETDIVRLATLYGADVHKDIENYYNNRSHILSSEASKWIVAVMQSLKTERSVIKAEVMVSDFIATASKIDLVLRETDESTLFDIKTTSRFERKYCTLQLSVYKFLYEYCYEVPVKNLYVLSTKKRRLFPILYAGDEVVKRILAKNKEKLTY